jgi:hypothetical protein
MEAKMLLKLIKETITVIVISSIFGAGTCWLGAYVGSNNYFMAEGDAMVGVEWLVVWGTMAYYLLLRKYITLQNLSGLMVLSALISMIPAIIFHISTPVITSFLVILGSLYIWRTGNKKAKLEV